MKAAASKREARQWSYSVYSRAQVFLRTHAFHSDCMFRGHGVGIWEWGGGVWKVQAYRIQG